MASLIPGYEYDIFISYRQKDNKGDRWVSEFVEALKTELESTFKEEISVYFDINPHDGLLETYDVDESLKEKLKCLVFIPVISRTYCDPKSFAWEQEFKAFIEQARNDQYGLKVKLAGGNISSRVLPIQIHDLNPDDKKLVEGELGGFLRGIEFIYKEAGVNRPLKPDDDERINLNKTKYRNQINKVANAISEIIEGLKNSGRVEPAETEYTGTGKSSGSPKKKTRIIAGAIIALVLIISGIYFFPKLLNRPDQIDKSIAVLPFKSLSADPEKQYLADGMMEAILLHLSKIRDLRVPGSTTVERYRQSTKTIEEIGKELNVGYVLEGNFQQFGDEAKLIVQLIRTRNESHVWSEEYNRNWSDILAIQSEVAMAVANELKAVISPGENKIIETAPTSDLTAYDFYLRGNDYLRRGYMEQDNIRYAIQMFEKAVGIDPEFALAYKGLAESYRYLFAYHGRNDENLLNASKFLDRALDLAPDMKEVQLEEASFYSTCIRDYATAVEKLEKLGAEYPNDDEISAQTGYSYRAMGNFRKSLEFTKIAISLNPSEWRYWFNEAFTHWALREYDESERDLKQAITLNPSNRDIYASMVELYVKTGRLKKAEEYLLANENNIGDQYFKQWKAELLSLTRNYDRAVQVLGTLTDEPIVYQHYLYTKHLLLGLAYCLAENNEMSARHFGIEREFLSGEISKSENDHRLYKSLGIALAGLGLKKEALEAGRKALAIYNFEINPQQAIQTEYDMARIALMVGEYEEALTRLGIIMKRHGNITANMLMLDPFWDPVRNDPKFKEIVSNPAYQFNISQLADSRPDE